MKNSIQNKYGFTILRPGGNDQMLIKGLVPKEKKREINDEMIRRYPNVEQVSFYDFEKKNNLGILELAGGEFCGNATRCLAYLLLKGRKGLINIKVSGTSNNLKAGINKKKTAFAQMPIPKINYIKKIRDELYQINLEGITQLVCLDSQIPNNPTQLKSLAFEILKNQNLVYSMPAAGVMFIKKKPDYIEMKPVVWVRDIETLLLETACASGTASVGIFQASQNNKSLTKIKILQPSGKFIFAEVYNRNFPEVYIDGEVEILQKGVETI